MTLIDGQPSDEEIAEHEAEDYFMALTPDGRVVWVCADDAADDAAALDRIEPTLPTPYVSRNAAPQIAIIATNTKSNTRLSSLSALSASGSSQSLQVRMLAMMPFFPVDRGA